MHNIIVKNRKETIGEVLVDFSLESFKYEYSQNDERELSFTAYKTNVNADVFNMLQNEAIIEWKGQKFIIKQIDFNSDSHLVTVDVVAKHIYMEFQNHYILKDLESEEMNNDSTDEDTDNDVIEEDYPTYDLKQYLDFGFKDNKLGFKYNIIGTFDKRIAIDSLGDKNGIEYLSEGAELFGYIYFADNKLFHIYIPDKFYKRTEEVLRYKYNTDSVKASISTTDMKTYIRGFGKKKTKTETRNYSPMKTPEMDFKGNFIKKGTWRTETKGNYYEREFNCKWGNETLVFSLKKGEKGGIWDIYLDNKYIDTHKSFSRTSAVERIVVAKNIKKGKHIFKAVFKGADPNVNYKSQKPTGYVGTEKQNILNLTAVLKGEDLYHYKAEYKSPNYSIFGHAEASTIFEDKILDKKELEEKIKNEIQDEPKVEVSTNYLGSIDNRRYIQNGEIKENSIIRFVHEPLGYNTDLKVVKITEYHPLLNKPVEVDFSNEREDIISIQLDINKKLRNINTGNVFSFTSTSADIGLSTEVVGSVILDE